MTDAGLRVALEELMDQEREMVEKPTVLTPSRFMEIKAITKKELINIDTISEVYPHIRDGQMVCRIVFVNGEDVTALHTYEDIKAALKQYYK